MYNGTLEEQRIDERFHATNVHHEQGMNHGEDY